MRWLLVLSLLVVGCSEKSDVPVSPGAVLPRDMDSRQWSEFLTQSGIQGDRTVKSFTPTWTGFAVAPVGDLSYLDYGSLVALFNNNPVELVGTSNTTAMTITNLPAAIRPREFKWRDCLVVNNDFTTNGSVGINTNGTLQFFFHQVTPIVGVAEGIAPQAAGFNNANNKGVPAGWLVLYSK